MRATFTYLTGGRAGQAVAIDKSYAMLGRSPQADVRFGPDHDLVVSARHAAVVFRGGAWILRDLASTNGTFVNGAKVEGEHQLADQDLVRLGDGGPILRFGLTQGAWTPPASGPPPEVVDPGEVDVTQPRPQPVPPTPIAIPYGDVAPGNEPVPPASGGSLKVLGVISVLAFIGVLLARQARAPDAPPEPTITDERNALVLRADSIYASLDALRRASPVLGEAVTEAQAETARIRSRIRRDAPSGLGSLRDSLAALERDESLFHSAAAMDLRGIAQRSEPGIALVVATYGDGSVRTATALMATRRGRPVLVTTRAITVDADGKPASLAIVDRATGELRATRVVRSNSRLDLALIDVPRGMPLRPTAPLASAEQLRTTGVAVLLGSAEEKARSADASAGARNTVAALGVVQYGGGDDMELETWGSALAPGSVVVDSEGRIIGIVLGVARDPARLRALPATAVTRFLAEGTGAS